MKQLIRFCYKDKNDKKSTRDRNRVYWVEAERGIHYATTWYDLVGVQMMLIFVNQISNLRKERLISNNPPHNFFWKIY